MDDGRGPQVEDTGNDNGSGWRFELGELDDAESEELKPGSPRLEHALFVLLGVLATLFALFRALFA